MFHIKVTYNYMYFSFNCCPLIQFTHVWRLTHFFISNLHNHIILSWDRFVQAAVSLAVVIPCLLELQEQHYGVKKGIPTLVMAAASFDNVLCISAFGVCLGIAFDSGTALS